MELENDIRYEEREQYNKVISVKLVIPSGCNANCEFCYMKDKKIQRTFDRESFLKNFISSIEFIIQEIGNKNPVSLDITGNEPTFDTELLKNVLIRLKDFQIKDKVLRTTITTNGYRLKEVVPYFNEVVDYVNISVHDYRPDRRKTILGCETLSDDDYKEIISNLENIGIKTSAVAVIYNPIENFSDWRDEFIDWCKYKGFIGLRIRHDVYKSDKELFEKYMYEAMKDGRFKIITHETTVDSHWCRLRRFDGFRVFFLCGVAETYIYTKGIEYCIDDDGLLYADFYKRIPIKDYKYEIGKVFDRVGGF